MSPITPAQAPAASTAWHEAVGRAFLEVVDLPLKERRERLETMGASNTRLRSAVEDLLEYDRAPSPLDCPIAAPEFLQKAARQEPCPLHVGSYSIVGLLGRGGMASVYRARQASPDREVALKVLEPTSWGGPGQARRFRDEARALARLCHPNIAAIYEAGVDHSQGRARPFIAMELVEGSTLDQWRHATARPIGTIVELMARVADAVQHAHQRGVIHRDIKPRNIVVSGDGTPKVLDFGIARLVCAGDETRALEGTQAAMIGTLAYMSPEQVHPGAGTVDTRSDVYALGCVLFELIAGVPPVDLRGLSLPQACSTMLASPTRRVRELSPSAPRELELIVAKAMDRDQARRYASAGELAIDLRRFLRHEPILARQPSVWYNARKFARREPALCSAVLAAVLASLIGVGAFAWQARVARAASTRAMEQARAAEAVTMVIERAFAAMSGRSDGSGVRVIDVLDRASRSMRRAREQSPATAARLHLMLGNAYLALGQEARSTGHLRMAIELQEDAQGEQAMRARLGLSHAMRREGNYTQALELARLVCASRTASLGPRHPDTLESKHVLAQALMALGELEQAAPLLRQCADESAATQGLAHRSTLNVQCDLATVLQMQGCASDAREVLVNALVHAREGIGEVNVSTGWLIARLGCVLNDMGRHDEAMALIESYLGNVQSTLRPRHILRSRCRTVVACALREQGQPDKAAQVLRAYFTSDDGRIDDLDEEVLDARAEYARCLWEAGEFEQARYEASVVMICDANEPLAMPCPARLRRALIDPILRGSASDRGIAHLQDWLRGDVAVAAAARYLEP